MEGKRVFLKLYKFLRTLALSVIFLILVFGNIASAKDIATIPVGDSTKKAIPIAMATDNNYVYPTLVSMTSMLESKNKDTKLDFNIMLSGIVTGENKEKFKKLIKHYPDCTVNLVDMKDKFSSAYIFGHLATPAYYRLSLPSLLPGYEKILYIDGDTVINEDLQKLFDTNIDGYYVGGVLDLGIVTLSKKDRKDYAGRLGIYDVDRYINSGVLLMNTKMMRKDKLEEKFNDYIPTLNQRGLGLADQDVINAVCYGKIKLLSPIFNTLVHVFGVYEGNKPLCLSDCCSDEEWARTRVKPVIIHWASPNKPWKNQNIRFYSEWKKYRDIVEKIIYGEPVLKDGLYTIISALNEWRVLDISNSSQQNGGNLQLWEDNGTCAQTFRVRYAGEGYYEIESLCSGKFLDVEYSGKTRGTNVWQYERNGTDAQKWLIKKADDDDSGYYYIISKCNGLSLDVEYSGTKSGTNIWVWDRNGTNAQKFKFVA